MVYACRSRGNTNNKLKLIWNIKIVTFRKQGFHKVCKMINCNFITLIPVIAFTISLETSKHLIVYWPYYDSPKFIKYNSFSLK